MRSRPECARRRQICVLIGTQLSRKRSACRFYTNLSTDRDRPPANRTEPMRSAAKLMRCFPQQVNSSRAAFFASMAFLSLLWRLFLAYLCECMAAHILQAVLFHVVERNVVLVVLCSDGFHLMHLHGLVLARPNRTRP